jgi:hypothetical protein
MALRDGASRPGRRLLRSLTFASSASTPTSTAADSTCRRAVMPAALLRSALGYDRVLSDDDVDRLARTAWTSLHPAA